MQVEADIMVNGVKLTDAESMTVRVAIDTLANVLAEGLEDPEGRALADRYVTHLGRIQRADRESRATTAIVLAAAKAHYRSLDGKAGVLGWEVQQTRAHA